MTTTGTITILYVIHCYQPPKHPIEGSLWLVPGTTGDFEDGGEYSGTHIDEYVKSRGILIKEVGSSLEEAAIVEDVKRKFEAQGFKIVYEVTAND